ncbi:MAG: Crp/Fnr family transcriptional regulator [Acidimicrobiia bacterium]|nr:Crp/Fnr family transcriptional regulator [Acidimicrobiia bacterium]
MALTPTDQLHFAWLARCFGKTDYLPLSPTDLAALSHAGSFIDKYQGTHLFREGEPAVHAYVIEKGEVELYRTINGIRRVVARAGEGNVLGDIAMFRSEPYISSARAIGPVSAFRFDRDKLMPVLIQHPVITLRWLVAGLGQLEATQRRVLRLMSRTVKEQVAELLIDEADDMGEVHLSQNTIATLLGASRQTVNEALSELRRDEAVETGYRHIRVKDATKLGMIASPQGTVRRVKAVSN